MTQVGENNGFQELIALSQAAAQFENKPVPGVYDIDIYIKIEERALAEKQGSTRKQSISSAAAGNPRPLDEALSNEGKALLKLFRGEMRSQEITKITKDLQNFEKGGRSARASLENSISSTFRRKNRLLKRILEYLTEQYLPMVAPQSLNDGRDLLKDRMVPGSPQLFFSALRSCAPHSVYQAVLDSLVEMRRLYRSRDHTGAVEKLSYCKRVLDQAGPGAKRLLLQLDTLFPIGNTSTAVLAPQNQYQYTSGKERATVGPMGQQNGLLPGPNTVAPYWSHNMPGHRMDPNGSIALPSAAVQAPMGAEGPPHQGPPPGVNNNPAAAPVGRDNRGANGHAAGYGAGSAQASDQADAAPVHSKEEGSAASSPLPGNVSAPRGEYPNGPQSMQGGPQSMPGGPQSLPGGPQSMPGGPQSVPGGQQQMYPGGGHMQGMWGMNQPRMMPHPGVPRGQPGHAKMGQQMTNMYQQSMMQRGAMMPQQMVGGMYGQPRPRGQPYDYYRSAPPGAQHQMQDWRQQMGMHNPTPGPHQPRYDSTFIYPQFGRNSTAPLPSLSHLPQLQPVPHVSDESHGRPTGPSVDMHNRSVAEIAADVSLIRGSSSGGGQK